MPTNIRINKRHWDQPYSLVRAHSGSQDENLGGNVGFNFSYKGSWAPEITQNENATYFRNVYSENEIPSVIQFDSNNTGDYTNLLVIQNFGAAEAYTYPYDGLGAVVCEAVPGSTWEWSVKIKNVIGPIAVTIDMYIFGLNEAGDRVSDSSGKAFGHYDGSVTTIPNDKTNYYSRQIAPADDTQVILSGKATLADIPGNNPIRYISMRLDVNSEAQWVEFYDWDLNPLNQKRSEQPLIWNSPKIFKPVSNLSWGIGSTEQTSIGNGAPHEYLRVALGAGDDNAALVTYLDDLGLLGWRYGPDYGGAALSNNQATGGTTLPFPDDWSYNNYSYGAWLLNNGGTPSGTGPANGIPSLPEYVEEPTRRHFGFKRSQEPSGSVNNHNYLYVEGSSGRSDRYALRLPEINFNETTREETLSFYFHANGNSIAKLSIWYSNLADSFYLPSDFSEGAIQHGTITNIEPGQGEAAQLPLKYFKPNALGGAHINDYHDLTEINGETHANDSDSWHRAEVDLTSLRGLSRYLIILYDGITGWSSDFAISNIMVSGMYNDVDNGCTDPDATNYDPTAIVDDGSCVYAPK